MILSGYLGSPRSRRGRGLRRARQDPQDPQPKLTYCCDPAFGDRDRGLFVPAGIPPLVRDRLCPLADIITPNHFEFEFLCGTKATTTAQVIGAAQALMARGPSTVVVTSAELEDTPGGEIETVAIEKSGKQSRHGARARRNCRSARPAPAICLPRCSCRARSEMNTPDALGHAVSAIFAVLERTASSGTEEMRIVESAELLVRPRAGSTPSLSAFESRQA
jgi:pyridoxine kinase